MYAYVHLKRQPFEFISRTCRWSSSTFQALHDIRSPFHNILYFECDRPVVVFIVLFLKEGGKIAVNQDSITIWEHYQCWTTADKSVHPWIICGDLAALLLRISYSSNTDSCLQEPDHRRRPWIEGCGLKRRDRNRGQLLKAV